jgi:hypothetical protein
MNSKHYFSISGAAPGSPDGLIAIFDNNTGATLMRGLPECTAILERR